ncbi:MAG: hypothetical protein A2017_12740 [Lentisphaerae bacterium GWF2_44_16]|nr:MAG: hypothetical protein A2017_12740 [Lentisphaerae bacterium GWF2_44_16]
MRRSPEKLIPKGTCPKEKVRCLKKRKAKVIQPEKRETPDARRTVYEALWPLFRDNGHTGVPDTSFVREDILPAPSEAEEQYGKNKVLFSIAYFLSKFACILNSGFASGVFQY